MSNIIPHEPHESLLPKTFQVWKPARDVTPEQIRRFTGWLGDQALSTLINEGHEKLKNLSGTLQYRRAIVRQLLRTDQQFAIEFAATAFNLAEATRDTAEAGVVRITDKVVQDGLHYIEGFDSARQWVDYYSRSKSGGWAKELARIADLIPWMDRLLGEKLDPNLFYDTAFLGKLRPLLTELEVVIQHEGMSEDEKARAFEALVGLAADPNTTQKEIRDTYTRPRVALGQGTVEQAGNGNYRIEIVCSKGRAKTIVARLSNLVEFAKGTDLARSVHHTLTKPTGCGKIE